MVRSGAGSRRRGHGTIRVVLRHAGRCCGALLGFGALRGSKQLGDLAIAGLQGEAGASFEEWLADNHALCHGSLGNALIFASAGSAARDPVLLDGAGVAFEMAVRGLEADDAVCWGIDWDLQRRDLSNELEGAAGIALGLLTLIGDADSVWLRLHALKPVTILPEVCKGRYDAGKIRV